MTKLNFLDKNAHYGHLSGKERYAIPLLTESKGYREQVEEALNNPDNAISKISIQAKEHFEINRGSENVSLLKESYKL